MLYVANEPFLLARIDDVCEKDLKKKHTTNY